MTTISANTLKTQGVGALAAATADEGESLISVRGQPHFVVMTMARYNRLREAELDEALSEVRADIRAGRELKGGISGHLRRINPR